MKNYISLILCLLFVAGCGKQHDSKAEVPVIPLEPVSMERLTAGELRDAALNGRIEDVKKAVNGKVDVNEPDQDGRTALMLASFNGHLDIVDLLINSKASVTAKDATGRTALMYASTGTDGHTVELLIRNGAKINEADGLEHFTPLMWAAAEGNSGICRILLAAGADPAMQDVDGDTAESFAVKNGHLDTAAIIQQAGKKKEK